MNFSDTTVVIPTLNEENTIGSLITRIFKLYPKIHILIADDDSKDRTHEIVKKQGAELLNRKEKTPGLCASVLDGIKASKTKYCIIMDGDLQHPPEKIGAIHERLQNNNIVVGVRNRILVPWPWHRKLMSKVATILAKIRIRFKCSDPMSGFFGIEKSKAENILSRKEKRFELRGYKVLFDFLKYSKTSRIGEIKYDFGLRRGGDSKIRMKHILLFLRSIFK